MKLSALLAIREAVQVATWQAWLDGLPVSWINP